jgi:hypothetical protein
MLIFFSSSSFLQGSKGQHCRGKMGKTKLAYITGVLKGYKLIYPIKNSLVLYAAAQHM